MSKIAKSNKAGKTAASIVWGISEEENSLQSHPAHWNVRLDVWDFQGSFSKRQITFLLLFNEDTAQCIGYFSLQTALEPVSAWESTQVPVLLKQHAGKNLRGSRIFLFLPTYFLLFCKYGMSFWHRRAKSVTKTITLSLAKIHRLRHWHIDGKNNPKQQRLSFETTYPIKCGCNVEVVLLLFKYSMICLFYLPPWILL